MKSDDTRWADALTQATREKAEALARVAELERVLREVLRLSRVGGGEYWEIERLAVVALGGGR